jgi:hypothetical protein
VFFALGISAVLACSRDNDEEDDNQFREDVIWCEEAVAHLEKCCPNFDTTRVACTFYYSYDEGCGTSTTRRTDPAFDKEESRCIRNTTCDALVAQGVCERARDGGAARSSITTTSSSSSGSTSSSSSGTTETSPPRPQVCP